MPLPWKRKGPEAGGLGGGSEQELVLLCRFWVRTTPGVTLR